MRDQLDLTFREGQRPRVSLEERFAAFLRDNPHAMDRFCELALEAIRKGHTRWSGDAIVHVMRWLEGVPTKGDEYRFDNSYVSLMVRVFQERYPEHSAFFVTKKRRAA